MTLIYAFSLWMLRNTSVDIDILSVFFACTLLFDCVIMLALIAGDMP